MPDIRILIPEGPREEKLRELQERFKERAGAALSERMTQTVDEGSINELRAMKRRVEAQSVEDWLLDHAIRSALGDERSSRVQTLQVEAKDAISRDVKSHMEQFNDVNSSEE